MTNILNQLPGVPEFVGTAAADTIGLVIANVDEQLRSRMNLDLTYPTIGLIGSRTGAGAQIKAVDDAAKMSNIEVLSIELPRDTKSGGGHGNFIIIGGKDVSDVRQAVELSLKLIDQNAGELYISEAGHLEVQFTARAGKAIHMAFGAPIDKAFGFICSCPAPIGMVIADLAMKSAGVELVSYGTPTQGTSFSNEVVITISGEADAVRQAVIKARETGIQLLYTMGEYPDPVKTPYL